MKKNIKILFMIIFTLLFVLILSNNQYVMADDDTTNTTTGTSSTNMKDILGTVDGATAPDTAVTTTTQNIVGTIINAVRIVGTGIAIIMMIFVAIKYMTAAPSEKADFKKSATAMVVGAVVLFAGTNILSIIANFATTNISAT